MCKKGMAAMMGLIFNIQKFSLNDGPGIRTVVFLKGCPLRCRWCSNPESQETAPQILWDADRCRHCGTCVAICPHKAIRQEGNTIQITHSQCENCGDCISHCPAGALKREGEYKTVDEVVAICRQDKDFYEESGGGVTLSGGEMLMQPAFAAKLIDALHAEGISVAAETTGFAGSEVFLPLAERLDDILFDLKHWDGEKHLEGTGVPLQPILENMHRAIQRGRRVLPRIPVIPGYNDSIEVAVGFCRRLKEVGAERAQLLPFHQFGEKKYAMLGRGYTMAEAVPLHQEDLIAYRDTFLQCGIKAFF